MSFRAFDTCLSLMKKDDALEMIHVDPDDGSPDHLDPIYIKQEFELKSDKFTCNYSFFVL